MKENSPEKRRKIGDLTLTSDEWERVRLFNNLLQVGSLLSLQLPFINTSLPARGGCSACILSQFTPYITQRTSGH